MSSSTRRRELGRGERVVPGIWRLRLPLPWPGVPHCNASAVAAGDGIVLFDCGLHEPGSLAQLQGRDRRPRRAGRAPLRGRAPERRAALAPLREWSQSARERGSGIARLVEPDRELLGGVVVETDLGPWTVVETARSSRS